MLLFTYGASRYFIYYFAATFSQARAAKMAQFRNVARSIIGDRATLVTGSRPGTTDKAWNMLCLNPQLHRWWGEMRFGLKCLGVTPTPTGGATVSIPFVWMPQQQSSPRGQSKAWMRTDAWRQLLCMDTGEGEEWLAEWRERARYGTAPRPGSDDANAPGAAVPNSPNSHGGIVAAVDARTGRPLRSGAMFSVPLSVLADAHNMKAMLDLQWACINIACMSAAAGSDDFLAADEYDDTFSGGLFAAGILSYDGLVRE
ncbi:hypothetical protein F503_07804 [Ophiostoma piceae UAMH 11346]|uniref:HNH nuclease domain-containing protein n=1 Tax=Ophiostoma piceae (strain UAMH 11346) TaxID=1262450 RepID=S3CKZ0_OPHP1|nr:hypothetical protein F503_07804 [Ophiostoma piceae UAMH 11346]